jgi:fructose-1,6-bisphosphatase II / sedoheptulose-1,7-bisphosphatase
MTETLFLDQESLSLSCIELTENTAVAVSRFIGAGDEYEANKAATESMLSGISRLKVNSNIVAGNFENSGYDLPTGGVEANNSNLEIDIAVDPLEGQTLTAKGLPNALSVIAFGKKNAFLQVPKIYMEKLVVGPIYKGNNISLEMCPTERILAMASIKNCEPDEISVCILERPRNLALIEEIRKTNAKIKLISDGDIAGTINCLKRDLTGIDCYMGSGGAQEGILSAIATKCLDGHMEARFKPNNDKNFEILLEKYNLKANKIYRISEMVKDECIFSASGITDNSLIMGVKLDNNLVKVETLFLSSKSRSFRKISMSKSLKH